MTGAFRTGEVLPEWCELRAFSLHRPDLGQLIENKRRERREKILVTDGRCQVFQGKKSVVLRAGQFVDIDDGIDIWTVAANTADAEYLHLSGIWGDEIAGCGVWVMENDPDARDTGDPVDYPKTTRMDSHYHDYDEFWFIIDGGAKAVVGDSFLDVTAGDCVIIPAWHHHDMPEVTGRMRGAFFETSLMGQRRMGHLWTHTHGAPQDLRVWSA